MLGEIPRWALERACTAIGRKVWHFDRMGDDNILRQSIAAHALLIASTDKPPVDRKLLVAREVMGRSCRLPECANSYRTGEWDYAGSIKNCISAIELWEEGFAK